MKTLTITLVASFLALAARAALASHWLVLHAAGSSRDYELPPPHHSARLSASDGKLRLWLDRKELRVDNAWLKSISDVDFGSARLAHGSDDPDLFVLLTCGSSGLVVLRVQADGAVKEFADGCDGG